MRVSDKRNGTQEILAVPEIDRKNRCFHHIYFNNFFTGLLRRKIYACGTMKPDRQDFPTIFRQNRNFVISIW